MPAKQRKIAMMGYRSVGKSSLIIQFVEGQFVDSYDPTIENTFTKTIRFHSIDYEVKLVDTAGQDEFSIFPSQYSMDFHGYVLVYSITSRKSFQIVQIIYDKLLDIVGKVHVPIVLVGNKTDLHTERKISTEEGKRLAEKWKASFVETSAKQNEIPRSVKNEYYVMSFPECPASLRPIQHYLKTATEHEGRDPCVVYWCRVYALQLAIRLQTKKAPDETALLLALMDWLEKEKKNLQDNETVTNEVAAQAHLENYALKLFLYADKQDREGNYGKNVVKAFYTSGMIYDVLQVFGELTEEVVQNRKYAKWKAAYIHNCLKNGEVPVPGPLPSEENEDVPSTSGDEPSASTPSTLFDPPSEPNNPGSSSNDASASNFITPPVVNILPSVPHTPDPNPGGFHAYVPPASVPTENKPFAPVSLTPEQMSKAQKYCKWAGSALNYDDVNTAITNLMNALQLLQTGHDPA